MKSEKGTILVADDERDVLTGLVHILENVGYEVYTASNGNEALQKAAEFSPDLILLDVLMPGMDGKEVKAKLNDDPGLAETPVIFLSAKKATNDKLDGFLLEAEDYITKPFEVVELLARVRSVLRRRRHYEEISMTDGLTGLANVHLLKRELNLFFNIAKRYKHFFSIVVFDIDNFKVINDSFGHRAGDEVIKWVAVSLKECLREADLVARCGGDEFVALFPHTAGKQAEVPLLRFREVLKKGLQLAGKSQVITVSVSAGIAVYNPDIQKAWDLFESADKEMYVEKAAKKVQ